jgi:hypothetical protein
VFWSKRTFFVTNNNVEVGTGSMWPCNLETWLIFFIIYPRQQEKINYNSLQVWYTDNFFLPVQFWFFVYRERRKSRGSSLRETWWKSTGTEVNIQYDEEINTALCVEYRLMPVLSDPDFNWVRCSGLGIRIKIKIWSEGKNGLPKIRNFMPFIGSQKEEKF